MSASVEERIKTLQESGPEQQAAFLQNGGWVRLNDWVRQSFISQNYQQLKILLSFISELPVSVIENALQTEFILIPTLETILCQAVQRLVVQGKLGNWDESGIQPLLGQLLANWSDVLCKLEERTGSRQEQQSHQLLSRIDDSESNVRKKSASVGEYISEGPLQSNEGEGVVNSEQIRPEPGPVVNDLVANNEKIQAKLINTTKQKRNTKEERLKTHEEEVNKTKRLLEAIKKVKNRMKVRAEHELKTLLIEPPTLFKKRKRINKMLGEGEASMGQAQQTVAVPAKRQETARELGRPSVKMFLKGKSRLEGIAQVMDESPLKTRHQKRPYPRITCVENTIGTKAESRNVAITQRPPVAVSATPWPPISKALVPFQINISLEETLKARVPTRELPTGTTHKIGLGTEVLSSRQSLLDLGHRLPSSASRAVLSTSTCTALVPYTPTSQLPRRTTEPTTSKSTTNTVSSSLWHLDPRKKSWELAHANVVKEKGFQQSPLLEIEGPPWKLLKIHLPYRMTRRQRRRKIRSKEKEIQRLREMLFLQPDPPLPVGYCSSVPDSPAEPSPEKVDYSPASYVHICPYGIGGYTKELCHKKHPWPDAQQDDNVMEIRAVSYIRRQKNATPTMKQITSEGLTVSPATEETEEFLRKKSNHHSSTTCRFPVTDTLSQLFSVPYSCSTNSSSPLSSPRFLKTPSHTFLVAGQDNPPLPVYPPLPDYPPPIPVNPPLPNYPPPLVFNPPLPTTPLLYQLPSKSWQPVAFQSSRLSSPLVGSPISFTILPSCNSSPWKFTPKQKENNAVPSRSLTPPPPGISPTWRSQSPYRSLTPQPPGTSPTWRSQSPYRSSTPPPPGISPPYRSSTPPPPGISPPYRSSTPPPPGT